MRPGSAAIRLIAGLALALAFVAAIAPLGGGRAQAQENGLASITIYTAICPVGYSGDDFFEDCYDNPGADITYWLSGGDLGGTVEATTGDNGFTAFEGLDTDGAYALQIQVPGDFVGVSVFCSEDGNPFPFEYDEIFGTILLDLTTDNDIRCDWYITPDDQVGEAASITLYKSWCPVGYTGDDYFEDCYPNPASGIDFFLTYGEETVEATTGDNGFTAFEGLTAEGEYLLEETIPGDFNDFVVFCSKGGEDFPFEYAEGANGIILDLTTDDDIRCDWYNIPADAVGETASITIYKVFCPAGYTGDDYFEDCYDNPAEDIDFFLSHGGETAEGTTGDTGFVAFEGISEDGEYLLEEEIPGEFNDFVVFCSKGGENFPFEYADNANGILLDLTTDDDIRCDWYNIPEDLSGQTPTPQPSASPKPTSTVSTLPNTGAGADGGASGPFWPLAGALALLAVAGASLAVGRGRFAAARARQ